MFVDDGENAECESIGERDDMDDWVLVEPEEIPDE